MSSIDVRELLESASQISVETLHKNPKAIGVLFTALLIAQQTLEVSTESGGSSMIGP